VTTEEATTQAKKDLDTLLQYLDEQLNNRDYLVGDAVTLADISGLRDLL
jgi:glutathione S-transferase